MNLFNHHHIIRELFYPQQGGFIEVLSSNNQHKMVICLCVSETKYMEMDMACWALLGSWAMCPVYTNNFSFGQLKLRLGL